MKTSQIKVILPAVSVAVMMHLLLFAAMTPKSNVRLSGIPVSPKTSYMMGGFMDADQVDLNVWSLRSPLVFSLPSEMGFSRELNAHDVQTKLTFSQEVITEHFLESDDSALQDEGGLESQELLLTSSSVSAPGLPSDVYVSAEKRASARRVYLTPALRERLAGGVVLPAELNQQVDTPWKARARITISEGGVVQHILLDKPLESASLNLSLIHI